MVQDVPGQKKKRNSDLWLWIQHRVYSSNENSFLVPFLYCLISNMVWKYPATEFGWFWWEHFVQNISLLCARSLSLLFLCWTFAINTFGAVVQFPVLVIDGAETLRWEFKINFFQRTPGVKTCRQFYMANMNVTFNSLSHPSNLLALTEMWQ